MRALAPALTLTLALAAPAAALDVTYRATVAGLTIGGGHLTGDVGASAYDLTLTGDYGVAMWSSRFTTRASGAISGGRVVPARYTTTSEGRATRTISIAFGGGEARETIAPPPEPALLEGRVPLTEAHRRGVLDPLSGLLSQALRGGAAADPCEGVVRAFSGWARFDIGLRPGSGAGADGIVTCRVAYRAVAGHRPPPPNAPRPVEGATITVAFRPAGDGDLRLPERIEVPLTIGSLVIQRAK